MLKREDLESLAILLETPGADIPPRVQIEKLGGASPKLALACLEALALLNIAAPRVAPRAECDVNAADELQKAYDRLPERLRAALEAAGVEVEP